MADWPIFVLTLPGDEDRRAPLLAQLADAGLQAELVFGIDGRHGLPARYEAEIDRSAAFDRLGRNMTDGEFACALSHRAIYQRIVDQGLTGAIVFEDDARLRPDLASLLRARHHERIPLLLFYYRYGRALRFLQRKAVPGVVLRRAATQATSTMAYAIRADAARLMLRHTSPVRFQADWPCDLHAAGAWMAVPRLVQEAEGSLSHLGETRREQARTAAKAKRDRSIRCWLRERLSIRVGRKRGEI